MVQGGPLGIARNVPDKACWYVQDRSSMVGFGDHLGRESHQPWASHYVNYEMLKRKLDEVVGSNQPDTQEVFTAQKHIFQGLCDSEIEKVHRMPAEVCYEA